MAAAASQPYTFHAWRPISCEDFFKYFSSFVRTSAPLQRPLNPVLTFPSTFTAAGEWEASRALKNIRGAD